MLTYVNMLARVNIFVPVEVPIEFGRIQQNLIVIETRHALSHSEIFECYEKVLKRIFEMHK